MELQKQKTLTGEEIEFLKERVDSWKDIFQGKFFQVTVSENAHYDLDRMHEKGHERKVRAWISEHMRANENLPEGREGELFQADLDLFCKIL